MCSSKKKSSFRIDDILHHQSDRNSIVYLNQQNYNLKSSSEKLNSVTLSETSVQNSNITSASSDAKINSVPQCSIEQIQPRKPTPIYPQTIFDVQKSPMCYSMPIGMSHFPPAASYLEHYAQVMHKSMYILYSSLPLWNWDKPFFCHLLNINININSL